MVTEKLDFQEAENNCQARSLFERQSHLMSIASMDENTFLKNYTKDVFGRSYFALWIGLNDRVSPQHFVWTDGSNTSYRNFKAGEPTHSQNEDCVALWYGEEWNDYGCVYKLDSVCKMPGRFSSRK
ncbi:alpha-N-acetylgalactosamine-specific lectin-like [Acanthaster planci]|uniref:Alpha-N-acetylgalactosamine-specific lectin-like n=1 Tax=Acanthaster planci TaxID=133434 RepID=A0A8B8A3Z7_ACAPL|nr:alpha-N-acetylgalactosamine-specific lectin-like [Acanthaster planci]